LINSQPSLPAPDQGTQAPERLASSSRPRRRRSVLFMPGDDMRKIENGAKIGADAVVMDLEDGVAINRKQAAREIVRAALQNVDFGAAERLVRLNAPESGMTDDDLQQAVEGHPDGFVLPKVETAESVRVLSRRLEQIENERGWEPHGIRLMAVVETARGVMQLQSIAESGPRLSALAFGAEDLAGDMGATRTQEGWEVFFARSAVVIAAAANGLQALDMVFTNLHDLDGLRTEARRAVQMGYAGKMAIHLRQVAIINEVFTPTEEEFSHAQALLRAFEEHQLAGAGVFGYEGRMVDIAVVRAARRIVERAGE
jgi:citrate lyase beta subunit